MSAGLYHSAGLWITHVYAHFLNFYGQIREESAQSLDQLLRYYFCLKNQKKNKQGVTDDEWLKCHNWFKNYVKQRELARERAKEARELAAASAF